MIPIVVSQEAKEKLEKVVHPIISKLYEQSGGSAGGAPGDDDEDEHDEL